MVSRTKDLGKWGEKVASEYLVKTGYQVLDRNVRTEYGEIDLIAEQGCVLVFVEVKTRQSSTYGYPEESITRLKIDHMIASAEAYLQTIPDYEGDWRIDVVAVEINELDNQPVITHFPNAVSE
ncbi:MAG: YraN family protein [Anaerolineales bacterium]|jgi:putative endonuclease|nr:YraN family protein [Anaerolineales bacterium]